MRADGRRGTCERWVLTDFLRIFWGPLRSPRRSVAPRAVCPPGGGVAHVRAEPRGGLPLRRSRRTRKRT